MKTMTHAQVISHKIDRVLSYDLPRVGKYQPRQVYVELDSGLCFHFGQRAKSEPVSGHALIELSSLPSGAKSVVDKASDCRLDSSIKAIIDSDDWEASFGVLLENGNALFQGCNEWEDFFVFSTLSEASVHNYLELCLPTNSKS